MTNIQHRCRAKTPASCPFRSETTIALLKQNYVNAQQINNNLVNTYVLLSAANKPVQTYIEAILKSSENLQTAEIEYAASDEGLQKLEQRIETEEDLNKKMGLETLKVYAQQLHKEVEEGKRQPSTILPSKISLYTLPAFTPQKLDDNTTQWTGNKFNSTYPVGRVREFIKQDIKKATAMGNLPEGVKTLVTSDHKTNILTVTLTDTPTNVDRKQILKQLNAISKSYAQAKVTQRSETEKETKYVNFSVKILDTIES